MKKFLFVLLTAALALPMMAQVKGQADFRIGTVPNYPTFTTLQRNHAVVANRDEVPAGYASVTLNAADVWQDGTGYQMLLDADATAYGTIIPETGGLTTSGDAPAGVYDEFEYKIPENADGALATANILIDEAVTILCSKMEEQKKVQNRRIGFSTEPDENEDAKSDMDQVSAKG